MPSATCHKKHFHILIKSIKKKSARFILALEWRNKVKNHINKSISSPILKSFKLIYAILLRKQKKFSASDIRMVYVLNSRCCY